MTQEEIIKMRRSAINELVLELVNKCKEHNRVPSEGEMSILNTALDVFTDDIVKNIIVKFNNLIKENSAHKALVGSYDGTNTRYWIYN